MSSFDRLKAKYKDRELAGYYRERFTHGGRKRSTNYIWKVLQSVVGHEKKTLIDIPCGTGRFAFPFAEAGHRVFAADYSNEMLHEGYSRKNGVSPSFLRCDIRKLPFPDRSFDIAVCIRLFHLLQPQERVEAMRELRRVARDKIVVVYYPRHTIKQLTRWVRWKLGIIPQPRTRFYPWKKIEEEITAAGLKVESVRPACRWFIDDWIIVAR